MGGFTNSSIAFDDVREFLDRALASPKGVVAELGTTGDAVNFRQRCNAYRKGDRVENRKNYGDDDPKGKRSEYDCLIIRHVKGSSIVVAEKRMAGQLEIKELE